MNLEDVKKSVMSQVEGCRDFYEVGKNLKTKSCQDNTDLVMNGEIYRLTDWSGWQLCRKIDVPWSYAKRCPADLRDENINYWLGRAEKEFLVRTREVNVKYVRAVLSNSYYVVNNCDLLDSISPALAKALEYRVYDFNVDDDYFHLFYQGENIKDGVKIGFMLENSETGKRALVIQSVIYEGGRNMILPQGLGSYTHRHLGIDIDEVKSALEIIVSSKDIRQKVREIVDSAQMVISESRFEEAVEKIAEIKGEKVAEEFKEKFAGKSPTVWEVAISVSDLACEDGDKNEKVDIQRIAGGVLLGVYRR